MAKSVHVVCAIFMRDGFVFLGRRREGIARGLSWEFPGGKVREGETPGTALEREIWEELGILSTTREFFGRNDYRYDDVEVRLDAYISEFLEMPQSSTDHDMLAMVDCEKIGNYALSEADVPFAKKLAENSVRRIR